MIKICLETTISTYTVSSITARATHRNMDRPLEHVESSTYYTVNINSSAERHLMLEHAQGVEDALTSAFLHSTRVGVET
jgi:hypothetical protein